MSSSAKAIARVSALLQAGDVDAAAAAAVELRDGLAESSFIEVAAILDRIPLRAWETRSARRATVALLSNATTAYLARGLFYALATRGVLADVYEAPFDRWQDELVDPDSGLVRAAPDVVVIHLSALGLTRYGSRWPDDVADRAAGALRSFRARSAAPVFMTLPVPLAEERSPRSRAAEWRRVLVDRLAALREELGLDLVPLDAVAADLGEDATATHWITSKVDVRPSAALRVAQHLVRWIAPAVVGPPKLVITDLDDVLWGGVLGEVGWEGIDLDADGAGAGHLRLQRFLADLKARGVLLAACSKNDPADVSAALHRRPEMILREDDFAAISVGWEPKSSRIPGILRALGLSSAGVVFLDDHPAERAEVRGLVPDVFVPELPPDPAQYVPYLASLPELALGKATAEDLARGAYYAAEERRRAAKSVFASLDQYLASLAMRVTPHRVGAANLERVTQLVQRTNQFNVTTIRRGAAELARLAADDATYAFAFDVEDRFGPYGLTGVLIAAPTGARRYRVDTWLLSCRVMGRQVERAMLHHLIPWLAARGCDSLEAEFRPTAKNGAVAGLFPELGFDLVSRDEGGDRYAADLRTTRFAPNDLVAIGEGTPRAVPS